MISVIIPIYNAEKYLQRCLDTIAVQTYKDLEVIMIDDGSKDRSGMICYAMSENDNRFHSFHRENAGVAAARNFALSQMHGEYVAFIDADDYIAPNYFEALIKGMAHPGVDISYCRAQDEDESTNIISNGGGREDVLYSAEKFDWNGPLSHTVVWGALYRREILKNFFFDTTLYVGEDSLYFAQCIKRARKLYFVHDQELYHYVIYTESAAHGEFNPKKVTELTAWKKICDLYNNDSEVVMAYMLRLVGFCKKHYGSAIFREQYLDDLLREYKNYESTYLKALRKRSWKKAYLVGVIFGICPKVYLNFNGNIDEHH